MSGARRIVFDTSTLIGAAIRIGTPPEEALTWAFVHDEVWTSEQTLAELEKVLERAKFDRYLDRKSRRAFFSMMRRRAHIASVPGNDLSWAQPPCRDPSDNKFLALAWAAQADVLVTSDKDLLVLHPWWGILIMTPAEFVDRA